MTIDFIELENFRLHKKTKLKFSKELNYIVGGNGQGKTTILEGIYYLCTTKSLNQSSDNEAVNFDSNFFEVKGKFSDLTTNTARVYYDTEVNKKSIFIDDKQIYRASAVIGKFPVVTLTQSDHAITLGAPSERRKFVDSVISQSSETYLKILLEYNKTLRQRSSLLTQIKEANSKSLFDQLEAWTKNLIKNGTEIVKHRLSFISDFNDYLKTAYENIMGEIENPKIEYSFLDERAAGNIENVFEEEIKNRREEELRRATNVVGPHRDDFEFIVNDYSLKKYGSQGQHKTFQIALRFGEFFFLNDKIGRKPVFLMDDIYGELDLFRAGKISDYLSKIGQAFITMTDFTKYDNLKKTENDLLINVKNGKAEYA